MIGEPIHAAPKIEIAPCAPIISSESEVSIMPINVQPVSQQYEKHLCNHSPVIYINHHLKSEVYITLRCQLC